VCVCVCVCVCVFVCACASVCALCVRGVCMCAVVMAYLVLRRVRVMYVFGAVRVGLVHRLLDTMSYITLSM